MERSGTLDPSDLVDADLVTLPARTAPLETVEGLKSLLRQKMIRVFADIDHAAEAQKVGLSLWPTRLLISATLRLVHRT